MSNGGEATFGREKVESWSVRILVRARWPRNCYEEGERERIAVKGIRNKEGEREREERERTRERNGGTRGVCRGTERRNVDEDRTRYGDERGPGGQWVSGPGPLNS